MSESYIGKRIKFLNRSSQKEFFGLIESQPLGNKKNIARISGVGVRQISDWKNVKGTISLSAFEKLLLTYKIPRPKSIRIIEQYSHTKSAGKKGYEVMLKKYGGIPKNEQLRRQNWEKWWKTVGKKQNLEILKRKVIRIPFNSADLAEYCGILIGDGGLTKWQVIVTLNSETDKEYLLFIVDLTKKLFNVKPKINRIRSSKAINICVSRRELVDFLNSKGILIGNKLKQNLSIPKWIMESPEYLSRCIRGMVDTDGSVVIETHNIKSVKYVYYRLNFTSASPLLIKQTFESLKKFGFTPKIRRGGRSIQLEKSSEICEYFKRIGTSNPKHLERLGRSGSSG